MNHVDVPLRWFRAALTSLRTATTVGALTTLVAFGALSVAAPPQAPTGGADQVGLSSTPLDAMMERNRCSIVRTPRGETRLVSFDDGWAVFSGEAAGELVAVCLGPERAAQTPGR
jgi:hypothetical protein